MSDFTDPTTPSATDEFSISGRWTPQIAENLRHLHDLPTLYAQNISGSAVAAGALVYVERGANAQFSTTTTVGDRRLLGVLMPVAGVSSIAAAGNGHVLLLGRHPTVLATGTIARGDPLQASATVGRAQAGRQGAFATALTPLASGTGTIAAFVGLIPPGDTLVPTTEATTGAVTYTAAYLVSRLILRDPGSSDRTDTLPSAAALVTQLAGLGFVPRADDWLEFRVRNTAAGAHQITLAAGTGGTVLTGSSVTIPQGYTAQYGIRLTNVGSGTEAYDLISLAYGPH